MAVRSLLVLIGEVFTSSPFYWIPHLESTNLNFDGCYLGWLSLIRTLVLLKKFFFFSETVCCSAKFGNLPKPNLI